MDDGALIGTIAIVLSVATTVFGIINRSHIKSKCCGKTFEASIEIDRNMDSPQPDATTKPDEVAVEIAKAIVSASPINSLKVYKESMSRRASLPEALKSKK